MIFFVIFTSRMNARIRTINQVELLITNLILNGVMMTLESGVVFVVQWKKEQLNMHAKKNLTQRPIVICAATTKITVATTATHLVVGIIDVPAAVLRFKMRIVFRPEHRTVSLIY